MSSTLSGTTSRSVSGASINTDLTARTSATTSDSSTVGETIGHEQRPRFVQPALPTPTWPDEQGVFSLSCSSTIRAPLQLVVAIMLDTRTYSRWNAFCPGARVTHQPKSTAPLPACVRDSPAISAVANLPWTLRDGTTFVMEVCMDPTKQPKRMTTPNLQVSHLEQFTRRANPSTAALESDPTSVKSKTGERTGVRLAWRIRGKIANLLTRAERVQEFIIDPDDPTVTEYVCWETYYGVLAPPMRHVYGKGIKEGYSAWMDGLRSFAEKEWQRQTAPPTPPPPPPAAAASVS